MPAAATLAAPAAPAAKDAAPLVRLSALTPGEVACYHEQGFVTIPGLLSRADAAALRGEVMEIMRRIGLPLSKLKQTSQYLRGSGLDRLVNSRELLALARQLLGGPGSLYLPFTAVKSGGGGRFHFHQDNQYTRHDGPAINCWVALEDMSPENGCLYVVPYSHLNGTLESALSGDGDQHRKVTWEPEYALPLRLRAGDGVAFSRLTVHGSGRNSTATPRVAYAVQFHRNDSRALWEDGRWRLLSEKPRFANIAPTDRISEPGEAEEG